MSLRDTLHSRRRAGRDVRYDAFISYSHEADDRIALGLRDGLHQFAKPWRALRAARVFLDRTSLAAAPELWPDLRERLDASSFLILLASPAAAGSEWVGPREVAHWLSVPKRADHLILACTDGRIVWDHETGDFDWQLTTALPDELRGALPGEPLYVDMTWAREKPNLSLRNDEFLGAVATIAARIHGRERDDLVGEDVRQHKRTRMLVRLAIGVLTLLLAGAIVAATLAILSGNEARRQRDLAVSREHAAAARLAFQRSPAAALRESLRAYETEDTVEASSLLRELVARGRSARTRLGADLGERAAMAAAVSADGRHVALGGYDGQVLLSDLTRRGPAVRLAGSNTSPIEVLSFSADRTALAAGTNEAVYIWDLSNPDRSPRVLEETGPAVAFGPREAEFATVSGGRVVHVEGSRARRLPGEVNRSLGELVFSRNGRALAAIETDGSIVVWDIRPRPTRRTLSDKSGYFAADIDLAPDAEALVAAQQDGRVMVWDLRSRRAPALVIGGLSEPLEVRFSRRGDFIVAANGRGDAAVWRVATPKRRARRLSGLAPAMSDMHLSRDGRLLTTIGTDASVVVRELNRAGHLHPLPGNSTSPLDVALSADGKSLLASSGFPGYGQVVYRKLTARWRPQPTGSLGSGSEIVISPDGRSAAGVYDGDVFYWDLSGPTPSVTEEPAGLGLTYDVSLHGRRLAAGTDAGVELLALGKRQRVGRRLRHTVAVEVAFSADGSHLASFGESGLMVWDLRNGAEGSELPEVDNISDLALDAHGRRAAATVSDGVAVWDVGSIEEPRILPGQLGDEVSGLHFSPDGQRVLARDENGIRLWDLSDGGTLRVPGTFLSAVPTADGAVIIGKMNDRVAIAGCDACGPIARVRALAQEYVDGSPFWAAPSP